MKRANNASTLTSATIKANIVTLHGLGQIDVLSEIQKRELKQFSAMEQEDGTIALSFPMRLIEHVEFAGLIHRQNVEAKKLAKKGGKPDNDPTPPKGTPPMGGGGSTTEFENTTAIAA